MLNRTILIISIFLLSPCLTFSQKCDLKLSGHILDSETGLPISNASIIIIENQKGSVSLSDGYFQINQICKDEFHICISHLGCKSQKHFIKLKRDSSIQVLLDNHTEELESIKIIGTKKQPTQKLQSIDELKIIKNSNQTLSNMIESIPGVSVLRNGSGISKPMVHGLYGNRLTILNNGVAQSGQQWGNDHSPEIDPLVANKISVIQGAGSLEYQASALGAVILIEPQQIKRDSRLRSKASYFFESNGLANSFNIQTQKHSEKLAWKLIGTLKKSGDKRTANYYLRNTGSQEANIALLLEKTLFKNWYSKLYFSSFNTQLAILRGSHIGNLTDLKEALTRDEPFYTEKKFSYKIDAPNQKVNHHLLKFSSKYFIDEQQWLELTYAAQLNKRKEFDIRRSGRSETPAMSLDQSSHFFESKYHKNLNSGWQLKTGFQFKMIDNTNSPDTGVLPLIPDYQSYESGVFFLASQSFSGLSLEFGSRFDYIKQNVAAISRTIPRRVIHYNKHFKNYSIAGDAAYSISEALNLSYKLTYATRNPGINELYSNGLHQGVGGIEEGDVNLKSEKSLKSTFALSGTIKNRFSFDAHVYYQNIDNYIILSPQNEVRLTIRGAFPIFKYEQCHAEIYGADLSLNYKLLENLNAQAKYSHIKGRNLSHNSPLINMPSKHVSIALRHNIEKLGSFEKIEIEVHSKLVFKQTNLLSSQDFVSPPPGYNLIGVKLSAQRQFGESRLNIYSKIDNILNENYRDYLNRQRYFADDMGFNFSLGFSLSF